MNGRERSEPEASRTAAPVALLLFGATATGKTALAVELARRLRLEIVSADSRQVYRHLDIGTAKPRASERAAVPHHLIDFLDLHDSYNAARFTADALRCCDEIRQRGRFPVVVGGAGFYLQVLLQGLFEAPYTAAQLQSVRQELQKWNTEDLRSELERRDPQRAAVIHCNDRYRLSRALEICIASGSSVSALTAARRVPTRRFLGCWLTLPRAELHRRIERRTAAMLDQGWIEEVRRLLQAGTNPGLPGMGTLGYPHVVAHVQGQLDLETMRERIVRDTRRYARHQETWFRKFAADLTLRTAAAENATLLEELLQPWSVAPERGRREGSAPGS